MRRLGAGCRPCPRPRGETLRHICMALAWCTHGVCTCSKMSVMAVTPAVASTAWSSTCPNFELLPVRRACLPSVLSHAW